MLSRIKAGVCVVTSQGGLMRYLKLPTAGATDVSTHVNAVNAAHREGGCAEPFHLVRQRGYREARGDSVEAHDC